MFTEEQIAQLRELLKAEVGPIHERLDAQRDQIDEVRSELSSRISGLEHSVKDLAEILGDPVFTKLDNHEARLEALETELLHKPSKH
ncbi:hypothetical protein GCM10023321_25900 [Pseudonocardia eucalypti]|uniref:Uncharacterized protein n=1 Tax=Pseudonocardia eucalypti TaxID=648755 RepID=A0ABP9PYS5_9PSEU|nr:uncharacterized protein YceH (UPF0502 family) [Pseudonocardia eucalypti]